MFDCIKMGIKKNKKCIYFDLKPIFGPEPIFNVECSKVNVLNFIYIQKRELVAIMSQSSFFSQIRVDMNIIGISNNFCQKVQFFKVQLFKTLDIPRYIVPFSPGARYSGFVFL